MKISMRRVNELMERSKELVLDGRDPETYEDWCFLVYYWHCRIDQGDQPEALLTMCKLYKATLSDEVIRFISNTQRMALVE
jgi:hypothetical protein